MKFAAAIITFAIAATAQKLPPGSLCQTSKQCNAKCANSEWAVRRVDEDYVLICEPSQNDPVIFFTASCDNGAFEHSSIDTETTSTVCEAQGGTTCKGGCVVSAKSSGEEKLRQAWRKGCTDEDKVVVIAKRNMKAAKAFAQCDDA